MSKPERRRSDLQRGREHADPDENVRPLPWFLVMFLGAMGMWGAFYIYSTPSGVDSSYGDQRTVANLRPPVQSTGTTATIDGKQIFATKCAACHQATGQGIVGVFPPLAASEWVLGDERVLSRILLHGINGEISVKGATYKGAMPAWGAMSDAELAAVLSHVRAEWGNQAQAIKEETIKAQREATRARTEPYKSEQEIKSAS